MVHIWISDNLNKKYDVPFRRPIISGNLSNRPIHYCCPRREACTSPGSALSAPWSFERKRRILRERPIHALLGKMGFFFFLRRCERSAVRSRQARSPHSEISDNIYSIILYREITRQRGRMLRKWYSKNECRGLRLRRRIYTRR